MSSLLLPVYPHNVCFFVCVGVRFLGRSTVGREDVRVLIGLNWLGIRTNDGPYQHGNGLSGSVTEAS